MRGEQACLLSACVKVTFTFVGNSQGKDWDRTAVREHGTSDLKPDSSWPLTSVFPRNVYLLSAPDFWHVSLATRKTSAWDESYKHMFSYTFTSQKLNVVKNRLLTVSLSGSIWEKFDLICYIFEKLALLNLALYPIFYHLLWLWFLFAFHLLWLGPWARNLIAHLWVMRKLMQLQPSKEMYITFILLRSAVLWS